jgi:hypothetical protein
MQGISKSHVLTQFLKRYVLAGMCILAYGRGYKHVQGSHVPSSNDKDRCYFLFAILVGREIDSAMPVTGSKCVLIACWRAKLNSKT